MNPSVDPAANTRGRTWLKLTHDIEVTVSLNLQIYKYTKLIHIFKFINQNIIFYFLFFIFLFFLFIIYFEK